jgi:hypothetical protein
VRVMVQVVVMKFEGILTEPKVGSWWSDQIR